MLLVLLKIVIAHVIGDFVLQPKWLTLKRKQHIGYLLLHIFVHFLLLSIFFFREWSEWIPIITIIASSHMVIDSLKIWWERKSPSKPFITFCIDQTLHLITIFGILYVYYDLKIDLFKENILIYLFGASLVLFVSPVIMQVFFSKWDSENAFSNKRDDTLSNAGLVIGILERIIIVLFIQIDFYAGIGFLMAAKSIFRFGDLTSAKNTKFTEYILIGTFLSFTIAIVIGFIIKLLLLY